MSWRNPFRRKRQPSPPSLRIVRLSDSPEDWCAGDKAVCVGDGQWVNVFSREKANGPQGGSIHEVAAVTINCGAQCLCFAEFGELEYLSSLFRKVRPDEAEACTSDFVKLLNRLPAKVDA